MKYLMLALTEPIAGPVGGGKDIDGWVDTHDASGERFFGDRLADAAEAKTLRIRADGPHVTDGAFSPAHQSITGLDILDCDSIERAVEIALAHPMARGGVIEVRPFYDWDREEDS
jgi:Uncharacterized protein conserved in bacteria